MGRRKTIDLVSEEERDQAIAHARRARQLTVRLRRNEAVSDERADAMISAKACGMSSASLGDECGLDSSTVDRIIERRRRRLANDPAPVP